MSRSPARLLGPARRHRCAPFACALDVPSVRMHAVGQCSATLVAPQGRAILAPKPCARARGPGSVHALEACAACHQVKTGKQSVYCRSLVRLRAACVARCWMLQPAAGACAATRPLEAQQHWQARRIGLTRRAAPFRVSRCARRQNPGRGLSRGLLHAPRTSLCARPTPALGAVVAAASCELADATCAVCV